MKLFVNLKRFIFNLVNSHIEKYLMTIIAITIVKIRLFYEYYG